MSVDGEAIERGVDESDSVRTTCFMCRAARPACVGTFRGGDPGVGVELCPPCCRRGLHEPGCCALYVACFAHERRE